MPKAAASAREVPEGPDGLPMPGACWNPDDTAADDASISAAAHPAAVRFEHEAGLMMVAAVLCFLSKVHKPKKHVPGYQCIN